MRLSIILFLIFYSSISCDDDTVRKAVVNSHPKAVYIEARTKAGVGNGEYGDVVLIDILTREKQNLTDDEFYDLSPVWSPDGMKVLFQSNRRGDDLDLSIQGVGGPHQVYTFDLKTEELNIVKIKYLSNFPWYMKSTIWNLDWYSMNEYVFQLSNHVIYTTSVIADTILPLKNMKDYQNFSELHFAAGCNFVALDYYGKDFFKRKIAIVGLDNDEVIKIDLNKYVVIQDWKPNEKKILYTGKGGKLYEYNYQNQKENIIFNDIDKLGIAIRECKYFTSDKLLCLASKKGKKKINGREVEILKNSELVIINLKTREIEWLTNNGLDKESLDLFVPDV